MTDPCKYERLYKDDALTNEPDYDDELPTEDEDRIDFSELGTPYPELYDDGIW